jgi:murein DD-endopeptidase MepM/ murein hydrolase activator NlpD
MPPAAVSAEPLPTGTPILETAAPTPTATNTAVPEPTIYYVQEGDTLLSIALEFDIDLERLRQANGLTGDLISINQALIIPPPVSGDDTELPVYYVQEGETFTTIAQKFGLTPETLQAANPDLDPATLQVGQPILVPLGQGEIHYTVPGDTLLAIALLYDVSMDDLVRENADILNLDNLDIIQPGWLLKIPQGSVAEGYDCTPQLPRTEIIEYTVKNGERLYCLSEKFGVSMTTLLYANFDKVVGEGALTDGLTLLIPYDDGALYIVTAADIAAETTLQDLMAWYGIQLFDQITDWQNNPVSEPLEEGQQLFIHGADLLAGTYRPPIAAGQPTAVPPVANNPPSGGNAGGETAPPRPNFTDFPQPVGEPPPGAVFPLGTPWISVTELDTGFCPVVSGSGWSGGLSWPVSGRTINENRGFRLGHSGIDINAPLGSPVFAAQSGVVVWAGWSTWGFGNLIVLAHGGTWHTYYAHLSEVNVACGQSVGAGTTIGATGQTGAATWPHLHFEVRNQGFSYNPANYLP